MRLKSSCSSLKFDLVDLVSVFRPFEAPGVMAGDMAAWDVDEAQGCGGWIVWQILGCYNLNLPELLKYLIFYYNHRRVYLYPIISFKQVELEACGWSHIASN